MPTNMPKPIKAKIGLASKLKSFAAILLNIGKASCIQTNAINSDKHVMKIDSDKNCLTSWNLPEPTTFLIPTSLALLDALAVERLTKLTQATTTIKSAIPPKIYTYILLPPGSSSVVVKAL